MNKTNLNYTAPEVEIISIETQICFASSPVSLGISSDENGLRDLDVASTDWN